MRDYQNNISKLSEVRNSLLKGSSININNNNVENKEKHELNDNCNISFNIFLRSLSPKSKKKYIKNKDGKL